MNIFVLVFANDSERGYNVLGVIIMGILLLINFFFAGFSSLTVTSRIGYAMARDKAFPYSKFLAIVHKT
jgi:amino acid transporter